MPSCPKDGTLLEADYGMVTCPTCGSILMIDLDGNANLGSDAGENPPPSMGSVPVGSETPIPGFTNHDHPFEPTPSEADSPLARLDLPGPHRESQEPGDEAHSMLGSEASPAPRFDSTENLSEPADERSNSAPEDVQSDQGLDMDQLLGYAAPPADPPVNQGSPGDPLGIQGYANSELSQAKDGPLLFKVIVEGIDSKEIREALREALDDVRFAWDVSGIMRSITKGRLLIDNVSPVKATILINRIKRLPVRILWEQYAITQSETY